MTLARKMSIVVLSLLMLIFIGSYLISLNNERNYFVDQMGSNAQDTATSLGLSLSHALGKQDKAMMVSMVQAVFDRGYFSMIEVRNLEGKLLVSRYQSQNDDEVPTWFSTLVRLQPAVKSSIVMSGWNQVGEVFVATDPNYALKMLWKNAFDLIIWYAIFALLSLLIVYYFIQWLLKPLKRVTEQAQEICARQFPIQQEIPKTPELRKVTLAMNHMVIRIKRLFNEQLEQMEKLRDQSFQDSLTGLGNRRYFLQQLTSLLSDQEEFTPGFMLLVALDGLEPLNKEQGYQKGDEVISAVAKLCTNFWPVTSVINLSRIGGSNFALLIRELETKVFLEKSNEFNEALQKLVEDYPPCTVVLAITPYSLNQKPSELLTEADNILKRSRSETGNVSVSANLPAAVNISHDMIVSALTESHFSLYAQWVASNRVHFHREVFVRILEQGQEINAGYFMPIAEKTDVAYLVDEAVLAKVIASNLLHNTVLALNITQETMINTEHRTNYLKHLANLPKDCRNNLHIEFNETSVLKHFSKILLFVKSLQKLDITVGIDQVGINFSPMHYLNDLPINYIKLHGSLFHDIADNQNKQFFIHYFDEMAKTLDIKVIATAIETEAQWEALQNLGITWAQGQFLSPVEKLLKDEDDNE